MSADEPLEGEETVQEYDPRATAPVRLWLFCRACRCRFQVRLLPRPDLAMTCLCGNQGVLSTFDAFFDEERAREVAEAFELGYQAAKSALAEVMAFPTTRMYRPGSLGALLGPEEEGEAGRYAPPPFEREADYRTQIDRLTAALRGARDLLARHEALAEIVEFTYPRRHLRFAARSFCLRACEADMRLVDDIVREAQQARREGRSIRLRFPSFRSAVDLYEEAGNRDSALATAMRARMAGLPNFEARIEALKRAF